MPENPRSEILLRSAELRLLVACVRSQLGVGQAGANLCDRLAGPLDWGVFLRLADRHGLRPLAYRQLRAYPNAVPRERLADLEQAAMAAAARSAFLCAEMFRLLALFEAAGIRAFPIKGPVLAVQAYGDVSLREFTDIDFLIEESGLRRARDLLLARGYAGHVDVPSWALDACVREGWGFQCVSAEGGYSVDLRARVVPRYFAVPVAAVVLAGDAAAGSGVRDRIVGESGVARGPVAVPLPDGPVSTLSAAAQVYVLCVHGTKHLWARLVWVADVAGMLCADRQVEMRPVLELARRAGTLRMVLLGLALAREVVGANVAADAAERIAADRNIDVLVRRLSRGFAEDAPPWRGPVRFLRFQLRARERLRERLRYVWLLLVSPTYSDWRSVALPAWAYWMYYVIRPFRLAGKAVRSLWRRLA